MGGLKRAACFGGIEPNPPLPPLPLTLFSFPSLFVFHPEGNECISANAKYCGECIQAGAKCGWCKDPVRESKLSAIMTAEKCSLVLF